MWPFKRKNNQLRQSPVPSEFEQALSAAKELIAKLDSGGTVEDEFARSIYFDLVKHTVSNGESVASGLLATTGAICVHKRSLTPEFLPEAIRPIYYLGLEDLESIREFILGIANSSRTYLGTDTTPGQKYLREIAGDRTLLVNGFRKMYEGEDNQWRLEDAGVPDFPPILTE